VNEEIEKRKEKRSLCCGAFVWLVKCDKETFVKGKVRAKGVSELKLVG